jgi:DNA-binding response OmpR family regulator
MSIYPTPRMLPVYSARPQPIPQLQLKRVLIVEDERRMREQLVREVEALGCTTFAASGSHDAIKIAVQERPHVILIDGLLPQMHGFELARFLRAIDSTYRPRIAIVTSIYKHVRYRNEARLKYGVDDYIIKPVTTDALLEVLS